MSGLFGYGLTGTALQNNLVDTRRKHFVLEEDMLEGEARASSQTAKC
jgi:glycyl-tRNA synthetase